MNGNLMLLDSPEDECCEARGWVSINVPVFVARDMLAPFCADEHGAVPARPIGDPRRVWLRPDDTTKPPDEQRWHPCTLGEGVEFWEFDTTDTEAVRAA